MRRAASLLAALLAASAAATAGAKPPACEGRLTGAVSGKFACVVRLAPGGDGELFFVITPRDRIEGVPTYQPGSFQLPRPVRAGKYTLDTLGVGMASVAAEGGTLYTATKTSSQRGEVTLTLATVRADPATAGAHEVHGSYRARLSAAGSGKRGEVVVEVRF